MVPECMTASAYDWSSTLKGFHDQAWKRLARGVADRRAAARHPTLATVGLNGGAEARTVVLRAADRTDGMLELHTDRDSEKVAELHANPAASLHIWDLRVRMQIRLRVLIRCHQGALATERWQQVPSVSRWAYGGNPAPGGLIHRPTDYRADTDVDRFMLLLCTVQSMELLHLAEDGHRRALFRRADGFAGNWLAP